MTPLEHDEWPAFRNHPRAMTAMTDGELHHSWTIPAPGEMIAGKYVVDGLCGRGGLAIVLSAVHVGLGQRVAIKVLLPEWAGDPEVVERFAREGRAATRIKSEHVVRVLDVDTLDNGMPYLVLEHLVGHDLERIVAQWGPPSVRTAIDWVLQATEAIAEAHAQGIVHRDLKPANLFLTTRAGGCAWIKVIDFGLSKVIDSRLCGTSAKLTRPTDVIGSPHYMAPEQLRAPGEAGPRSDLWSLGAVLHELLTAKPPFGGKTLPELCASVLTQPPPALRSIRRDVPAEVEHAVLRCLEKDPGARFANAAELAHALAPYGNESAQESVDHIERAFDTGGWDSMPSSVPDVAPSAYSRISSWPAAEYPIPAETASARIVFGSLSILAGIAVAAFLWLHSLAHAGELPVSAMGPPVGAIGGTAEKAKALVSPPPVAASVGTDVGPDVGTVVLQAPAPSERPVPSSVVAPPAPSSEPSSTPRPHTLTRARPYRVEPEPPRRSAPELIDTNPYDENPSTKRPATTANRTAPPANVSSPANRGSGAAAEDPFDSRK